VALLNKRIQLKIEGFLRWWGAELAFLVPSQVRKLLGGARPVLTLTKSGDAARVVMWDRKAEEDLGLFPLDGDGGARAREALWRERPEVQNAEVLLNLTPAESLVKRFRLPEATEENLEQVAGFELDRLSPFRSEHVYYHARLVDRLPETKQIVAELALTPKSVLDPLLEELAACGWHPDRVEIAANPARRSHQLLPEHFRRPRARLPQMVNLALGGLALMLLLLIVLVPIGRDYRRSKVLEQELRRVSKEAKDVEALRQDAEKLAREARFVLDKKRSEPALVDVLNELTRVIPDNTWLYGMQYKDRRVIIQGQSPSASSLIAVVESSPYFRNTSFVSPVTKDVTSGLERFQIASEVINGRLADTKPAKSE
jgi:general secretion pathway protein L